MDQEIVCPKCKGTGKVSKYTPIEEMTDLELATEAHQIAFKNDKFPSSLVALLHELKNRLAEDC